MTSDSRPPFRSTIGASLFAAREAVMGPVRAVLAREDLTEQQWRALRVLVDEGPSDPSRIARLGLLYPPTVTRILKELGERGLVERDGDPLDRRRSVISATPAARALVDRVAPLTLGLVDRYARAFGRKRFERLQDELGALLQCLEAMAPSSEALRPRPRAVTRHRAALAEPTVGRRVEVRAKDRP